ncbi:cupin domain-containing protein [Myxococcus sp. K15C18031901]|uniref:(R)-mandelonitrile lyase n=1 Tax=Myxococcus dinghuensis TaxID=2906761 RepID=UPI0020A7A600|nr:cupin domain-containing protein [Myxococcus dinghuensis]MCP3101106.1 cupin domain-containing protein [Myxococcus dinghuensis]
MTIQRSGSRPTTLGPAAHFTGTVTVVPLFQAMEHRHASAGSVSFAPNARSAWHSHPAGQTLVVTSGTGWVQQWGAERQEIHVGDVIWTPPGVKHWHGATSTTAMTHTAIQESVDGKVVEWMEHVTDEQYDAALSPPAPASSARAAMTVRIAELDIDPARLETYLAIVRPEMTESIAKEPGVVALYAVAAKDDPAKLTFLELYANNAAYELHRATPHFQHYLQATSGMIVSRRLREAVPLQLSSQPIPPVP